MTTPIPEAAVEASARAIFALEQCDKRQMLDVESNWQGRLNDDDHEEYRALARAALIVARLHMEGEILGQVEEQSNRFAGLSFDEWSAATIAERTQR